MMTLQQLAARFQDTDTLANLTVEQSKAFVDLLILTVLIDNQITETELEGLSAQWSMLPFAGDEALEREVGEHGAQTRAFIQENFEDDEAMGGLLDRIAAALTDDDVREAALQMVAVVSLADGVEHDEAALCYTVGARFGFDEGRIGDMVNDILTAEIIVTPEGDEEA